VKKLPDVVGIDLPCWLV